MQLVIAHFIVIGFPEIILIVLNSNFYVKIKVEKGFNVTYLGLTF